jgi:hypothetical protein
MNDLDLIIPAAKTALAFVLTNWQEMLIYWLAFAVVGILAMYIGYGFAMAGKRARDLGFSQRRVVVVDVLIALPFVMLDAALNLFVFSVLFLDVRPKALFTLVTGRLCRYNADPTERHWRLQIVGVFAAFLNGKDPDGHHVKGEVPHFKWLD